MNHEENNNPSAISKLNEKDCAFAKTVFTTNFRRMIDSNCYSLADTYFNAKKEQNLDGLTDAFWFDAHQTCRSSYENLPLIRPFVKMVQSHITSNTDGIYLVDRMNPHYQAVLAMNATRSIYESFNRLIDFFEDIRILTYLSDTNSYQMEGYIRFKIVRNNCKEKYELNNDEGVEI